MEDVIFDVSDHRVTVHSMRIVTFIMLPVWGVLALLGPTGLHALADSLGMCCHVQTSVDSETAAGSDHSDCDHCARARSAKGDQNAPASPGHDSSNCRLCDWFLCWNAQSPGDVVVLSLPPAVMRDVVGDPGVVETRLITPVSRGPPAGV